MSFSQVYLFFLLPSRTSNIMMQQRIDTLLSYIVFDDDDDGVIINGPLSMKVYHTRNSFSFALYLSLNFFSPFSMGFFVVLLFEQKKISKSLFSSLTTFNQSRSILIKKNTRNITTDKLDHSVANNNKEIKFQKNVIKFTHTHGPLFH